MSTARYAQIEDGTVVNVIIIEDPLPPKPEPYEDDDGHTIVPDDQWAPWRDCVKVEGLDPEPGIGWSFKAGQWTPPAEEPSVDMPQVEAPMEITGPVADDVPGGIEGRTHVIVEHDGTHYALPLIPLD